MMTETQAFLRVPPFPGHRAGPIALRYSASTASRDSAVRLAELIRRQRVGGSFWGSQPHWPDGRGLLLAPRSNDQALAMAVAAKAKGVANRAIMLEFDAADAGIPTLAGTLDPWHLVERSSDLWADANHELAIVAALAGRPAQIFGGANLDPIAIATRLQEQWIYRCPFGDRPIEAHQAVEMLGHWRRLIDGNRSFGGVLGVAPWKRGLVDPLLWNGEGPVNHLRRLPGTGARLVAWKSRTSPRILAQLERDDAQVAEIEDGMIRGAGLGANCVPPLSVVVDNRGIYFDPSGQSDLEHLLLETVFDEALLERARQLRTRIVEEGVSKYGSARSRGGKRDRRRSVLVVGQVEDDRSVASGGGGATNWELLASARAMEPTARLIYRPHPDVDAGHRKGHLADTVVLRVADGIDRASPITQLIEAVDNVHVITSLAGFEALLRGTPVTTHGMPFYAGWGLTNDLCQPPARRRRRLSVDQLVAATLILYPRYVDPVTRLPCPPEILLDRIALGEVGVPAPLSPIRKLQGRLKRTVRELQEAVAG